MWLHMPLLKAALWAVVPYALLCYLHSRLVGTSTWHDVFPLALPGLLYFFNGAFYTHLFEYFYHKDILHAPSCKSHREHHRIFRGDNFQSQDADDLAHITTEWWVFPVLLPLHYALALFFVPQQWMLWLFLGITAYFVVCYEASHWFTHVKNNSVDAWLRRMPVLGARWRHSVQHHRGHHGAPTTNYSFGDPHLLDRLLRTHSGCSATTDVFDDPYDKRGG